MNKASQINATHKPLCYLKPEGRQTIVSYKTKLAMTFSNAQNSCANFPAFL